MIEYNRYAVGRVVRRVRKEKQLSQEIASGLAGLARSHLAMIENGSKQANFETVWKIANALGMCPHELVRLIEKEIRENEWTDKAERGAKRIRAAPAEADLCLSRSGRERRCLRIAAAAGIIVMLFMSFAFEVIFYV